MALGGHKLVVSQHGRAAPSPRKQFEGFEVDLASSQGATHEMVQSLHVGSKAMKGQIPMIYHVFGRVMILRRVKMMQ